jgi:hypothetical protein
MNATELTALFNETTKLKPGQTRVLIKIILKYEEVDELAYEAIGLLNNGVKYAALKKDFLAESFGWAGSPYQQHRETRKFRDNILANPPDVREGEMECPKCHKKQTLVVEMQTRSADEGFTYFIHCFNPKCKQITKT